MSNNPGFGFQADATSATYITGGQLAQTIERVVRDTDRTVPVVRLRDMDTVFADSLQKVRLHWGYAGAAVGIFPEGVSHSEPSLAPCEPGA